MSRNDIIYVRFLSSGAVSYAGGTKRSVGGRDQIFEIFMGNKPMVDARQVLAVPTFNCAEHQRKDGQEVAFGPDCDLARITDRHGSAVCFRDTAQAVYPKVGPFSALKRSEE